MYITSDKIHVVKPLYKGQVGDGSFVPWREVVLFLEVTNVLSLWEVKIFGRGCPLFGVSLYCTFLAEPVLSCELGDGEDEMIDAVCVDEADRLTTAGLGPGEPKR